jgi:glycosyl transferase family 25
MIKEMSKFDLDCEFIEAVDGSLLSEREISEVYDRKKSISSIGRELSRGEIGCALSHRKIYKKMIDNGIEVAVILEDDVKIDENVLSIFKMRNKFFFIWDVILLGHHSWRCVSDPVKYNLWYKKHIASNFILRYPAERGFGTYGYLINLAGAKRLFFQTKVLVKPIDHYTGNNKKLNLFIIEKPIITVDKSLLNYSNLYNERLKSEIKTKKQQIFLINQIKNFKIYRQLWLVKEWLKIVYRQIIPIQGYQ